MMLSKVNRKEDALVFLQLSGIYTDEDMAEEGWVQGVAKGKIKYAMASQITTF